MLNCRVKEYDLNDDATSASQNTDGLSDKKLKLAGYSYLVGDAAMVAAGAAREGKKAIGGSIGSGAVWFAGGLAAARYGNPDADKRVQLIANKLEKHLHRNGVTIPASTREQSALLKEETFWQRCEDFLYQHPSEVLNAAYALGAGILVHKGISQSRAGTHSLLPKSSSPLSTEFWIGATVLTGALGGLLLKEDPQAREKAQGGGMFARAKAWVTEKPLRFSGTLYTINNGFLAWRAKQDFSARTSEFAGARMKPHNFSTLQLATYLFGNSMLLMSSRDQLAHNVSPEHLAQLEDAAARIVAAQPPEMQQALLSDVSHYLAEQKGVGQSAPHIAQALAMRLTELTGERAQQAANTVSWVERERSRASAPAEQTL